SRLSAFPASSTCSPRTAPARAAGSTAGPLRGFAELGENLIALFCGKILHLFSAHLFVDFLLDRRRELLHHAGEHGSPLFVAEAGAALAAAARSTTLASAGGIGWRAFRHPRAASRSSARHTSRTSRRGRGASWHPARRA